MFLPGGPGGPGRTIKNTGYFTQIQKRQKNNNDKVLERGIFMKCTC